MNRRGFLNTLFGGIGALALGSKLPGQNVFTGFNHHDFIRIRIGEVGMNLEILRVLGELPEKEDFTFSFNCVYSSHPATNFISNLYIYGKKRLSEKKYFKQMNNLQYLPLNSLLFVKGQQIGLLEYNVNNIFLPSYFRIETTNDKLRKFFNESNLRVNYTANIIAFGKIEIPYDIQNINLRHASRNLPPAYIAGKACRTDL